MQECASCCESARTTTSGPRPTENGTTIRQAGLFTPSLGRRRVLPEYLLLIDRACLQDEQAAVGDELARRLGLSRTDMLGLAGMGSRLHSENIQRFAIDAKMVTPQTTPAYVLLLKDQKALRLLVNQMLDPSAAAAGGENPAP